MSLLETTQFALLIVYRASLARSNHSLSILSHKAYIFGGELGDGKLADTSVHVVSLLPADKAEANGEQQYAMVPALPDGETGGEASGVRNETSDGVPAPRSKHAACGLNVCVAIFGGSDENGDVIDEKGRVWLFNTAKACWEALDPPETSGESLSVQEGSSARPNYPESRTNASLFEHKNDLILYGGYNTSKQPLKDTWHFSYSSRSWTRLPDAPSATTNAALTDDTLFLLTSSAEDNGLSGYIHSLTIAKTAAETRAARWTSQSFPASPLTPAPKPRVNGGLLPVSTGHGRSYLLHFLGEREVPSKSPVPAEREQLQYPDLWTLQLPSHTTNASSIASALNPAAIKDAIRSYLPKTDAGTHGWAEVDVVPPSLDSVGNGEGGKVHPGPRAFFGCDVLGSETKNVLGVGERAMIVLWGGINAKGEREGDGWMVTVE